METMPPNLHGITVILSDNMVTEGQPISVRLTWWERLFSWPWRPWVCSVEITPILPSDDVIYSEIENKLIMHPVKWDSIKPKFRKYDD